MIRVCTLLFCCLLVSKIFAQDALPQTHPDYQRALKVYQKLQYAIGDNNTNLPNLLILDRKERVAAYRKADRALIIEKPALEVCLAMQESEGDAAIAFMIGHELTHFYQDHHWDEAGFGTSFLVDQETFEQHVHDEAEADTYGAFVMNLAGYPSKTVIPKFLDKIYKAYQLSEKLTGYPSLEKRKGVAKKAEARSQELIHIYKSANYFMAAKKYGEAIGAYQYVLKFVRTKELYSNLGATLLAYAIEHPDQSGTNFVYPLELEPKTSLRSEALLFGNQQMNLNRAIQKLKHALEYDPDYFAANLNLVCAYDLVGNYLVANKTIEKLEQQNLSSQQTSKLNLMKGILAARNGKKVEAQKKFEALQEHKSLGKLAQQNLLKLAGNSQARSNFAFADWQIKDKIDGLNLEEEPKLKSDVKLELNKKLMPQSFLELTQLANSYILYFHSTRRSAILQRITKSDAETTKGIHIGNSADYLKKKYSKYTYKTIQSRDGYFLIYENVRLIFKINSKDRIEEWAIYSNY